MQTCGSCSILVGPRARQPSPRGCSGSSRSSARPILGAPVAGYLAAYNTRAGRTCSAACLAPVIVLTSAAVGTLMLVGIDARTLPATGYDQDTADQVNLLNNVVVGMIVLFAAVMVVNAFAAVIAHRRAELHRLWLLGATRRRSSASVLAEAAVVAGVGVVLGLLASLATIVPFGLARHEGLVPDGDLWLPPLVVAGVGRAHPARGPLRGPAYGALDGARPMTDWSVMSLQRDPVGPACAGRRATPSSTGSG